MVPPSSECHDQSGDNQKREDSTQNEEQAFMPLKEAAQQFLHLFVG
jgi:hypothetical protein